MRDLVFISFDIRKDEYPAMPYSIAALVAALKNDNYNISHLLIDLQQTRENADQDQSLRESVIKRLNENIPYLKTFRFIAISVTAWSIGYCKHLLQNLNSYEGRIVLGGYEITALSDERLLKEFPGAHYYIRGYAERALKNILVCTTVAAEKFISETIEEEDIISPYTTGILNTYSKKIHWETKRGCSYRCGFCEWGNAVKKTVELDIEKLYAEIGLFKKSGIEEINFLDGTFNSGKNYKTIFRRLMELPYLRVNCQARFENFAHDKEFQDLCAENNKRIHLEFGLQTIHHVEMEYIGRKNDLMKVTEALSVLREKSISYEVSIIYGIPGQTVESFIDTIEFLLEKGCNDIMAYPLRIPRNSDLETKKKELGIVEKSGNDNILLVNSCYSFTSEHWADMNRIARRMNNRRFFTEGPVIDRVTVHEKCGHLKEVSPYQWEVNHLEKGMYAEALILQRIEHDFSEPSADEIGMIDVMQGYMATGRAASNDPDERAWYEHFNKIVSGELFLELKNVKRESDSVEMDNGYGGKIIIRFEPVKQEKKYRCALRIGKSGKVYVFRKMEYL